MNFSKKNITRLLSKVYREKVLNQFYNSKLGKSEVSKQLEEYARNIVDEQIVRQNLSFANDPKAGYGLSPITFICAEKKDGTIAKLLFEMNIPNHFLKDKDGTSAVEVMECVLAIWTMNDKDIKSFDVQKIDAELAKIEAEAKLKAIDETEKQKEAEKAEC